MRRGTRVGQAYVAVTADGTGINEEIVDSVEDAGPGVDRAGDRAGKRYGDRFSAGFRERLENIKDRIGARLEKQMGEAGSRAGDAAGSRMSRSMTDHLGDRLGEALADRLEFALANALGDVEAMIDRALVSGNQSRGSKAAFPLPDFDTRRWEEAARLNRKFDADRVKSAIAADAAIWKVRNATAAAHAKYLAQLEKGAIDKFGNTLSAGRNRSLGDRIGSLLGGGSRNNVLNAFGRSIGGVVNLVDGLRKKVTDLFSTFMKGFSEAAEGASFFQKVASGFAQFGAEGGGGISKMFSSIAASGPGAAVAIGVVAAAMTILVSVTSALLAILTALVATIASGLVGALVVASAGMGALIAAGGLLTAAFMSMTDAQKALLKGAFMPLKAEMVGIGQVMLQDMVPAFKTWSANLQEALSLALPVAQVLGKAFADAGTTLTKAFSGTGFEMFSQALASELPSIINNLASALGGFLNGTVALFAVIMPYVTQFSAYLNDVATRFAAWTSTTEGQNSIADFVDRAVTSLLSLWNFLSQVSGFFGDLFFSPQAQQAGNSIFDSMARSFEGFRSSIAAAAADGSLKKWFDDAIKFGGDFWSMLQGLGDAFKALYSSGVLGGVGSALGMLGDIFSGLSVALDPIVDLLGYVLPVTLGFALGPIWLVAKALSFLGDVVTSIVNSAVFQALLTVFNEIAGGVLDQIASGLSTLWGWLQNVWNAFGSLAGFMKGSFPSAIMAAVSPILAVAGAVREVIGAVDSLLNKLNQSTGYAGKLDVQSVTAGNAAGAAAGGSFTNPQAQVPSLVNSGMNALKNTGVKSGGLKKQWKNPYTEWANSLIKSGPTVAAQIKAAIKQVNRDARKALMDASKEIGGENVSGAMSRLGEQFRRDGASVVDLARNGLNSAAQRLASASSPKEAQRALRQVRQAQKNMRKAIEEQKRINRAAAIVDAQGVLREGNVQALMKGLSVQNATLADFAEARARVADKLDDAKQQLADAISLRDDFAKQVSDSVRDFASLVGAQAQTLNGVEQALTAGDVTANLQDRLAKIKTFQDNLRLLLAQGLGKEAYRQLIEAGVEGGSATAQALVNGGAGAIAEVNTLLDEIGKAADGLGSQAANRMYQAGVDAAQGLVDGLTSLSGQLDAAATRLGNAIAQAVAKALGIKSPSTRMIGLMEDVGDGAEIGLDNQHVKVGNAATRLADQIAVSPEVAAYAARRGDSGTVSGNSDQKFRDLIVQTPTEDPKAVAMEVLNEVTGAL